MTEEMINADGSRNWQANILLDNVKRLEQENKELKEKNENLRIALSTYEMPEVIKVLTDWRTGELQLQENKLNTYRSALEEIKKYIVDELCGYYHSKKDDYNEILEKIESIIDEVSTNEN